jgi:hypothetical protein
MLTSNYHTEAPYHLQSCGSIEPVPIGYPPIHGEQANRQAAIVQAYAKEMGRRSSLPGVALSTHIAPFPRSGCVAKKVNVTVFQSAMPM